ncbi:hypothetical protein GCM10009785_09750 [Brooklawnia cerclae]|uniref:Zorya protein ZorC EH domain-containing protein n=1 Tax=Brooklawnia cerclae TaxID=349934 RepID=A0ABX0SI69_9ACTN|nr:hypothetical protein [Brooklawnia cerclae]NIH58097.1 hypothetical protein [Brooklawnia cerclae]
MASQLETPRPHSWPTFGMEPLDASYVNRLIDYVDGRLDQADHRMLLLLKCMLASDLPPALHNRATEAVLGFRYSVLEPGHDSMTLWTESHQLATATAEYLAGQMLEDQIFRNDGRSGARHKRAAHARLLQWLSDRFRFGFSEWLSSDYYAYNAGTLALLIDHARDEALVRRASMVLDLLLTDVALHSFRGQFVPSMGRGSLEAICHPETSEIVPVWHSAFETADEDDPEPDYDQLSSLFVTRRRYETPAAVRETALDQPVRRVLTSQGLDADEVRDELRAHPEYPRSQGMDLVAFWWAQQAITRPETIVESVRALRALDLDGNRTLAPMRRFCRVPDRLLVPTLNTLNPVTQGAALQRANVQTVTTANYLLSSVQRYHPGEFGDQQHIWHATLPGDIQVFGTHPGSTELTREGRPASPGHWVGNGINPDVAQHHNVLLALYDLRARKGMLEGPRHELVHIHFPFVPFDQTRLGSTWVAGRRDDSYIGILGTHSFEQISETEIVQRGVNTGYAVVLGDDEEYTSFASFLRQLKQYRVRLDGKRLTLTSPYGRFELVWKGDFRVNSRLIDSWYPHYDSIHVRSARNPGRLTINGTTQRLALDWGMSLRESSPLEE